MTKHRPGAALDALDALDQIRDELRVVWLALTSPEASAYVGRIGEHVNALANRLDDVAERLSSGDGA